MELLFIISTFVISLALIILVIIQPRQTQTLSNDATSNIGKPSYWRSNTLVKILTLVTSICFFVLIFIYMIYDFSF
ncbi:MAG: preprotein translocase subunit SecG [Streptococcus sp.]|nr:preprotein translocase subunit SecG [Streptococcus sp.]